MIIIAVTNIPYFLKKKPEINPGSMFQVPCFRFSDPESEI